MKISLTYQSTYLQHTFSLRNIRKQKKTKHLIKSISMTGTNQPQSTHHSQIHPRQEIQQYHVLDREERITLQPWSPSMSSIAAEHVNRRRHRPREHTLRPPPSILFKPEKRERERGAALLAALFARHRG